MVNKTNNSFNTNQNTKEKFINLTEDVKTEVSSDSFNRNYKQRLPPSRQIIILERPVTLLDIIPILFTMVIYAIIILTICTILKKTSRSMYDKLIFALLLLSPLLYFLISHDIIFIIFWLCYILTMGRIYKTINNKPIKKETPRKIYKFFKLLFILTNLGIFMTQSLTIMSFFFFPSKIGKFFLSLLFNLYFGILSREMIFFFSETMAFNTGYYSKEGIPTKNNNNSICMICTKVFDNSEMIHTLICNHSFHEQCIKGWCMIAKKNSCPYCKKGVDLERIPKDIWYKTETWFYPLINTFRNFIVFAIFMFVYFTCKMYALKHN